MAMFASISEKLNHTFSKLTKKGRLTELEIKEAMREIKLALLEADVNFLVVKDFIKKVSEKAVGEQILNSLTPAQQVIKIVNEELTNLMGSSAEKLQTSPKPPTIIMLCGLQGAGKTTMAGKLALHLKKQGKKPLLVAADIYRPAAINQLQVLGKSIQIEVFERGTQKPLKTVKEALKHAEKLSYDTVIIDTAGRLHIDDELMKELVQIKNEVSPTEVLLTVDAMTGQDATTVATEFNNKLGISGVILTKLDGDTRGGAALSIRAVTGKPIKFTGMGEKLTDIEVFYPDRMASRILDKGDVLTLIEKAQDAISEDDAKRMEQALLKNSFTFEDYLLQFEQLKKMGNLTDLMSFIPGMGKYKAQLGNIDEKKLLKQKAIIQSMTKKERLRPELLKASRKARIAKGSATSVQEVNALIKQFEQTKQMMKQFKNGKGMPKLPF
jgi:signal recognition particle subunit SRP54